MTDNVTPSLDSTDFDAFKQALAAHAEGKTDENGRVIADDTNKGGDDDDAAAKAAAAAAAAAEAGGDEGTGDETDEEKAAREEAEAAVAEAKAAKEKNKGKSVQERIREFRRRVADAEEVAEIEAADRLRLENRVKELEAKLTSGGKDDKGGKPDKHDYVPLEGEPDPKDYKFGNLDPAYTRDLHKFFVDQSAKTERETRTVEQQRAENLKRFEDTVAKGLDKYDDYLQVVVEAADQGKWRLSPIGAQVIIESEFGHEVAYHLAKNPAEAAEIAELPPHRQAAALGRLEARFALEAENTSGNDGQGDKGGAHQQQNKNTKVSQAPNPPARHNARSPGGEFSVAPDTKDLNAYRRLVEKHRNKG